METASASMAMNWEPLPPREVSSRRQRRRMRTEAASSSQPLQQQQQHQSQEQQQPDSPKAPVKRKPNRPGFNSYLKAILDDATMDRLHEVAKRIQTKVQELEKGGSNNETTHLVSQKVEPKSAEEQQSTSIPTDDNTAEEATTQADDEEKPHKKARGGNNKKKNQPARFKARSRASLHMTFFFGGEYLCELPPNELQDWYDKVKDRLALADFVLQDATQDDNPQQQPPQAQQQLVDDYWFDVTDVRLFPPGRNNLVVAHLEAAPAWHDLHKDIRDMAKKANSQGLNDVTAYSKETWTAHITMGNLSGGGTKAQARKTFAGVLEQVMKELKQEREEEKVTESTEDKINDYLFKARTHGIGMGGPIPEQVEGLRWDFVYTPKQKPMSEEN